MKILKNKKLFHRFLISFVGVLIFCCVSIWISEIFTISVSQPFIYSDTQQLPHNKVWVVLGTSKYVPDGRRNLFYFYRIQAAKTLYDDGKIDYILVSGDNSTIHYNETDTMISDLVEIGIPKEKIFWDYAGFRTLDSVVRAKEIFWQTSYTIITQKFHLQRALFLAHFENIDAIGYTALDVPVSLAPRVWIRERFARVKMMIDILFWVQPKFGGEKIEIGK